MKWIGLVLMLVLPSANIVLADERPAGDYVVLLHGIARSSSHMEKLQTHLEQQGYEVINLDYPSTKHTLEQLVEIIHQHLADKLIADKPVHFVGYSMGGLLVRALVEQYRPAQLGRVVQLAPPNHGSEVADFLRDNWLYKKIYGPAGQQLTTDSDLSHLLGAVDYPLGIIAGNATIDPISSMIITGPDDGKVSVESTKLEGMTDHLVVSASHTFFPRNKMVLRQTTHFLQTGGFQK